MAPFPVQPVRESGWLAVGDGHEIYWEESGNSDGVPVLLLHGGPGSGLSRSARGFFDPERFRVVGFDQRGCGRSRPHAGDDIGALAAITTAHLVADIEALRLRLGVGRWALFGHSWGVTLGLAYAERLPERVGGAVFVGITTTRQREIDWLYHGLAPLFPAEWERFVAGVPDGTDPGQLVDVYHCLMTTGDRARQLQAALDFHAWDTASVSMNQTAEPAAVPDGEQLRRIVGRARIVTHVFRHAAWLEDGQLLRDAGHLAGIPGWLVQGRLDLQGPLVTAWELARAWPGSQLRVVENAGHASTDSGMEAAIMTAVAEMAERLGGQKRPRSRG